ncbi:sugar phosphate isomerase/epimerase [soil metagenome]
MQIGFLTACLPKVPLEKLIPWASTQGFDALEIAAWPRTADRDYMGSHIGASGFTDAEAAQVLELCNQHDIRISAMAYYDNNLHPDLEQRGRHLAHLRHVIDAAAKLGVELVGTFVGGRPEKPDLIMKEIGEVFRDVVAYAEDRGVRVMIENCPMDNWVQFGLPGNYAYSPELWDALFNEVPSENFGLNFDPSHLYWLGIDHIRATRDYGSRIFHAHAKDTEILPEGRYRHGVLWQQLKADPWKSGSWRYRMPGKGEINWSEFIRTLQEVGYDDVLSIEHEDPEFEGSEREIKEGLRLGLEHLSEQVAPHV